MEKLMEVMEPVVHIHMAARELILSHPAMAAVVIVLSVVVVYAVELISEVE